MSALTSLLVRDQVVSVRKIEEAIQKQVIGGGDLDSILLQMGLIEENVLSAYRAALFGLLPATRDEIMGVASDVVALVPKDVAEQYRLVPLVAEERVMVVAVAAPLTADVDEQLGFLLGHELVYRIAAEPRIAIALATHYDTELPPRLSKLANRLDRSTPGSVPYVRPHKENKVDGAVLSALGTGTLAKGGTLDWEDEPETGTAKRPSSVDISRVMEVGSGPAADEDLPEDPTVVDRDVAAGVVHAAHSSANGKGHEDVLRRDTDIDEAARRGVASVEASADEIRRRVARRLRGAITPKKAAEALAEATERDEILEVFFRFARQFFDCTVVFVVQDEHAIARLLYRDGQRSTPEARIPMTREGVFAELRRSPTPLSTSRLESGHREEMAAALDRSAQQPAMLFPVALRGRPIVILYGDRGGDRFGLEDLPELMAFVPRVAEALERLILRRKHEGYTSGGSTDRASLKSAAGRVLAAGVKPEEKAKGAYRASGRPKPGEPRPKREGPLGVLGVPRSAPPPPSSSSPGAGAHPEAAGVYSDTSMQGALSAPRVPTESRTPHTEPAPPPAFEGAAEASEPSQPPSRARRSASEYSLRDAGSDVLSGPPPRKSRRPDPRSEGPAPSEERVNVPAGVVGGRNGTATDRPRPLSDPAAAHGEAAQASKPTKNAPPTPEPEEPEDHATPNTTAITPPSGQPSVIVDMGEGVEELADELLDCGPDDEGPIVSSLLHLGEASLPALVKRFPGPLWFDRHRPHRRLPRGRDVSAVCRALVAFGNRAVPYVGSLLSKPDADVRFYATLLTSELVSAELLPFLGERVFDEDEGTQVLALDVLRRFTAFPALEETLKKIRLEARVVGREPGRRRTAARALGELRDPRSLEILVDLLASSDPELVDAGHRALVTLTRQDFGTSARRWLSWAERNGDRHRIEWLIEGLLHSDETLRSAAADELKTLTQEYYGYHPASPKKEREVAQRKYRNWWASEGRGRFAG